MSILICGTEKERKEIEAISGALLRTGFSTGVQIMNPDNPHNPEDLVERIREENFELVFPRVNLYPKAKTFGLEQRIGTGLIPNHLKSLGINVIGTCGKVSLRNKAAYYSILASAGFSSDFILVNPSKNKSAQIISFSGFTEEETKDPFQKYPALFVKPNSYGRSFGITDENVVSTPEDLTKMVNRLHTELKDDILIVPFYKGREFTVGIIGNKRKVFLPVEICQKPGYSKNKILLKEVKHGGIPSGRVYARPINDPKIKNRILKYAAQIPDLLGITDYTRIDFRQDQQGEIHAIDINGVPGLKYMESYISMAAEYLIKKNEIPTYDRLISTIVMAAAERLKLSLGNHPTIFE
jgi:hypothetical protein